MNPTDEETARRGRAALREHRELEAAFARVREAMVEKLICLTVGDERILQLHAAIQGVDAARKALLMMAQHGAVAEQALERAGL